jgi:hypothetical protein
MIRLNPDCLKPKMQPLAEIPKIYGKKVKLNPKGLPYMSEDELKELQLDINETIFDELGDFGEIVELSRWHICKGYVRPKGVESPRALKEYMKEIEISKSIDSFTDEFDESNEKRWLKYHKRYNPIEFKVQASTKAIQKAQATGK